VTRTLLTGGRVFDGTGAPPAAADVLVEDGRILEVGPGLDGDEAVDGGGRHLLPGLFDCHTHVTMSSIDLLANLQAPFSYRFFETVRNLAELELMAKGGLTPAQVLAATTSVAAELLGVADELGTLEPGKRADVVVVDGDPFELATLGDRIAAVIQDGRLVAGHV
jgi:imidazolonepropionase-like amidohydrolase